MPGASRCAAAPARDPEENRPQPQRRRSLYPGHLRGRRAERRAARHGQTVADLHLPFRLPGHGRLAGRDRHGGTVGHQTRARHRSGECGRFSQIPHSRQHAGFAAAAGRGRQGDAADAQLDDRHARRDGPVQWLPRAAEHCAAAEEHAGVERPARRDPTLARADARVQLSARSPARGRPLLRGLPQRPAAARRRDAVRPARHREDQRLEIRFARQRWRPCGQVLRGLRRTAPLRPPAGHREPLPRAGADGVPRRHHATGPDAQARPSRRAIGCGGVGPSDHLDRSELSLSRHLGRGAGQPRRAARPAP